jgi:hypothetical protein
MEKYFAERGIYRRKSDIVIKNVMFYIDDDNIPVTVA